LLFSKTITLNIRLSAVKATLGPGGYALRKAFITTTDSTVQQAMLSKDRKKIFLSQLNRSVNKRSRIFTHQQMNVITAIMLINRRKKRNSDNLKFKTGTPPSKPNNGVVIRAKSNSRHKNFLLSAI